MKVIDGERFFVYIQADYDGKDSSALLMDCAARFCRAAGLPCPKEEAIKRTARGKPYFEQPDAPRFSLSHSGGLWGCTFSRDAIGFDVERARARDWAAVAQRFFHPAERDLALSCGEDTFFLLWTAKESYVKYLGTGIDETFSAFSIVDNGRISGEALGVTFTRPPVQEGYYACVCTAAQMPAYLHMRMDDCRTMPHTHCQ